MPWPEQSTPAQGSAPQQQNAPVFSEQELDQILAPIALYPDQLLAQIFMAATYPLEIVEADRWLKQGTNAKLTGDQLANALQPQTWDPSVKSLVPFPQVLDMMSQQLSWTQKLGDAVLAQESDVMTSVQRLRQKAQSSGSLQTNQQQTVSSEGQTIIIQPADPQTVYVPVYQPSTVYGTWPYPSYPPYYYPPSPYYPIATPFLSGMAFAAGVAVVGSMWGWGNCNWGGGNVNINNNVYNNINRTNIANGRASTLPAGQGGRGNWQHNPQHRGGVAYRDQGSRQNYGRASTGGGQNFRGRDGAGAGAGNRPGQGAGAGNRPGQGAGAGNRPGQGAGAGNRPGQGAGAGGNRPGQGAGAGAGANRPSQGAGANRPSQGAGAGANRPSQGGARPSQGAGAGSRPSAGPSAFGGMNNGRSAGAQSSRGASSRGFSGGGGGGRGGGGGGRGGGGGGRGGGRR